MKDGQGTEPPVGDLPQEAQVSQAACPGKGLKQDLTKSMCVAEEGLGEVIDARLAKAGQAMRL